MSTKLRRLVIAALLLALAVTAWRAVTGPSPAEIEKKVEQQLQNRSG